MPARHRPEVRVPALPAIVRGIALSSAPWAAAGVRYKRARLGVEAFMKLGMIVVMTPDLDEARAFYRDLLGLNLTVETANQLIFDLDESELHVFSCADAAPAGYRHGATAATICAFEVASIEVEMRRMTAAGVVFLHAQPAENPVSGVRYAAFRAPGGNVHELIERRAAP